MVRLPFANLSCCLHCAGLPDCGLALIIFLYFCDMDTSTPPPIPSGASDGFGKARPSGFCLFKSTRTIESRTPRGWVFSIVVLIKRVYFLGVKVSETEVILNTELGDPCSFEKVD